MPMRSPDTTTLRRGLRILLALGSEEAHAHRGMRVVRVAEVLGVDKSQASRTLKTLAETGFVDRDPASLAYRLGWRLFALAARAGDQQLLVEGRPLLSRLVKQTGERSHLTVLQGTQVLTLLSEPSRRAIQAPGWTGRTVPAYCTSAGRALLMDHDREGFFRVFDGSEFNGIRPNAPNDADDLYERVLAARARGYAVVDEEFEPELVGVAAPVRDFSRRVVAALNVSAPRFRLLDRIDDAGRYTKAAADELSQRLGGLDRSLFPLGERNGGGQRSGTRRRSR